MLWLVCRLLRIRHPRIRGILYGAAVLDAVLAIAGVSFFWLFVVRASMDPHYLHAVAQPLGCPILISWLVGAGILTSHRLWGWYRLQRQLGALAGLVPVDAGIQDALVHAARKARIHPPRLLISPESLTPFLAGIIHPILVVSRPLWDQLGSAEREAMLLHELGHLRRRDNVRLLDAYDRRRVRPRHAIRGGRKERTPVDFCVGRKPTGSCGSAEGRSHPVGK